MGTVGVRALKQNASAVVAQAAAGELITITDRGRPVAMLVPIPADTLQALQSAGRARPARRRLGELGPALPPTAELEPLSTVLDAMRRDERY
jgi:prevent-host-death family protein